MRICIWQAGAKMAKALCDYCIEREEFTLPRQWNKENDGAMAARDASYGSHKKVWWQCAEGYGWKAVVYSHATGAKSGCPVCAGKIKRKQTDI